MYLTPASFLLRLSSSAALVTNHEPQLPSNSSPNQGKNFYSVCRGVGWEQSKVLFQDRVTELLGLCEKLGHLKLGLMDIKEMPMVVILAPSELLTRSLWGASKDQNISIC